MMKALAAWQNFYVIAGSSAGALIGLQFVVMSLIANEPAVRVDPQAGGAFSTPTIIHFSTVLAVAAILSAPWEGSVAPAAICGVLGLAGAVYAIAITLRVRRQTLYQLEFEDWVFYSLLPLLTYGILIVSAIAAAWRLNEALFGIAGAVLLLLAMGIHNAWDIVTYHVFRNREE